MICFLTSFLWINKERYITHQGHLPGTALSTVAGEFAVGHKPLGLTVAQAHSTDNPERPKKAPNHKHIEGLINQARLLLTLHPTICLQDPWEPGS